MNKKEIKTEIDSILFNLKENGRIHNRNVGSRVRSVFFRNYNPNKELSNISNEQAENILTELREINNYKK